jgi:citrate lyase beta subunit
MTAVQPLRSLADVRSLLFAPAWDAQALAAALASEADVVVADLEDLTPADRKGRARRELPGVIARPRDDGAIAVRINASDRDACAADLDVVARLPVDLVLVPKASPALLAELGSLGIAVIAIIETAGGLRDAHEIACAPEVEALALGANDLAADLGLGWPLAPGALAYARAKVVFDAAAAGLRAPLDRVTPSPRDVDAVLADAAAARELGFGGKSCIRPEHAAAINRVFSERRTPVAA